MKLLPTLRSLAADLDALPLSPTRHGLLSDVARAVVEDLRDRGASTLTFICTHNSCRSHLAQVLCATAAVHHGLVRIVCCSGGTEATACNERTVAALQWAGFPVTRAGEGDNPVYEIGCAEGVSPLRAWSKVYHADGNPASGYLAVMTCTHADENCPVVMGARHRFSLPYRDPKESDETPLEAATYDERLREIGAEMFHLMRRVREEIG